MVLPMAGVLLTEVRNACLSNWPSIECMTNGAWTSGMREESFAECLAESPSDWDWLATWNERAGEQFAAPKVDGF